MEASRSGVAMCGHGLLQRRWRNDGRCERGGCCGGGGGCCDRRCGGRGGSWSSRHFAFDSRHRCRLGERKTIGFDERGQLFGQPFGTFDFLVAFKILGQLFANLGAVERAVEGG